MTGPTHAETIFALSSGAPPAAIAIIRLSGPAAFDIAAMVAGRLPDARTVGLRRLRTSDDDTLDRALVLTFPGSNTATGEDLVEFHLHGGPAVVRDVQLALARAGARPAEAGEFTRRALAAGRIDLTEAEALADLLSAETEMQRRAALRSVDGALRRAVEGWTDRVVMLAARVEALLDHADEDDVADNASVSHAIVADAAALVSEITDLVARPTVDRLHDGLRVVFAGPPNSGKSSLFNAMIERDAAIVSEIAGTTRDRIEASVRRDGIAYLLIDTAGLRERTADPIEAIGIERAWDAVDEADIVIWLDDVEREWNGDADVVNVHARSDVANRRMVPAGRIAISVVNGTGIDALWERVAAIARKRLPVLDGPTVNIRQRDLLRIAVNALADLAQTDDLLLVAEHLRDARVAFHRITGRADVESMLDALFGRFCIGK